MLCILSLLSILTFQLALFWSLQFSHVLSLRFSKTNQNDQQLCSDWGCPSMHCNVCTVSSNGSAHPAKSGWLSPMPATNDLTDFFLAAASKEPPTLVVLLRARFRAPLPLPPEWRDTHASQQTNSQLLLRNQKSRLASPNLWWVRCIGWRERVCTKLIEAGMPAAASSLLQLTKLASKPG